jgi:segregation and condensation protein A
VSDIATDEGARQSPPDFEGGLRFRLPVYEGPLDLLLHLLKKNELDPHEVAASVITEQFLAYIDLLESLNLDVAGEYLVMSATLLLIKSFSLLPNPEMAEVEEAEDLKRDLVARLLEYQRYREAAGKLAERPILGRDVFTTPGEPAPESDDAPFPRDVSIFELVEAMAAVLRRIGDRVQREITPTDIPVARCIPRVLEALERGQRIEFAELFEGVSDRPLMIATFLALLELVRRGEVRAFQEVRFGPILLSRGKPHISLAHSVMGEGKGEGV